MLEQVVAALFSAILIIIGWGIKMHSRMSVMEQRHEDLVKLFDNKIDNVAESTDQKLEYITKMLEQRSPMIDQISNRLDRMERYFNGSFRAFLQKEDRDGH